MTAPADGLAGAPGPGVLPPEPERKRSAFALTPLADIMFQLLIFFMLSSSLAPYALLPMSTPATTRADPEPRTEGANAATAQVVWHLERGRLRAGDNRIDLAQLPAALARLQGDGIEDIVVFVTESARAQDLADLMEPVRRAGFARLQLIGR